MRESAKKKAGLEVHFDEQTLEQIGLEHRVVRLAYDLIRSAMKQAPTQLKERLQLVYSQLERFIDCPDKKSLGYAVRNLEKATKAYRPRSPLGELRKGALRGVYEKLKQFV